MLLKAMEDFNIDLSQSWMVGDGENDIKVWIAVGCHTALLVGAGTDSKRGCDFGQERTFETLDDFINKLKEIQK